VVEKLHIDEIAVEPEYDGMQWPDNGSISLEFIMNMIERFRNQKLIHRKFAYKIMVAAKEIFQALPTVVDVQIPRAKGGMLTVCGDVHGQFYDFLNIFKLNGYPSEAHAYLFNGDFVDRGSFSAEVILTILGFKVLYPNSFFMSRGNHETLSMNQVYGFEGEIKAKYNPMMFDLFTEIFNQVPLGNVIENRVFVVHGGLFSRDDVTLDELRKLPRDGNSSAGLQCEMLWSDPGDVPGRAPSKRGVALQFGPDVTEKFLKLNNLDLIIRSHEVQDEGYLIQHGGKCVTVFSAPNYCDNIGNKGAYINIKLKSENDSSDRPQLTYEYQKFTAVEHPPVKAMQYASGFGLGGMF
jgi:serine/threonine-protein phosphatase 5